MLYMCLYFFAPLCNYFTQGAKYCDQHVFMWVYGMWRSFYYDSVVAHYILIGPKFWSGGGPIFENFQTGSGAEPPRGETVQRGSEQFGAHDRG